MVDGGEKDPVYEDEAHSVQNLLLNQLLNYFLYKVTPTAAFQEAHFTPSHLQALMLTTGFTEQQ